MRYGVVVLGLIAAVTACEEIRKAEPANGAAPVDPSAAAEGGDDDGADVSAPGTKKPSKKKDAGTSSDQPSDDDDDATDPGPTDPESKPIVVENLVSGREKLGARSAGGYRPWRGGIVAANGRIYWAENGTSPGVYSAEQSCAPNTCVVTKISDANRVSAMAYAPNGFVWADVNVVSWREGTTTKKVFTAPSELTNLDTDGTALYWTSSSTIQRTLLAGGATSLANSNGSPFALAVAGTKVYWAGVDISGSNGLMQVVNTNGSGAKGLSQFSATFQTMRGTGKYLYYAKDSPAAVHRFTLDSGHDEVVASNAVGGVKDFAFDADYAYWVEPGETPELANGRVRRVAHDSTMAEDLAVAIPRAVGVAVDGKHVFVLSAGTTAAAQKDGNVLRITLP